MITNFGLVPLDITLTAWVKGPLHGTAFVLGLLGAGLVTGSLVGGMIVGRLAKVIPPKRMIHYGLIAQGVTIALTGAWANLYWAIALMTMAGFILALVNSSLSILLIGLVRPQMRGRVWNVQSLIVLASPLGLAVIGLLLAAASLWLVWLVIGGVSMLGGLAYFLPVLEDFERLSEVPQTADTSM